MTRCVLTFDLKSKRGKYFVKSVLPMCKHVLTIRPNNFLNVLFNDGNWVNYVLDVEDYIKCKEMLEKFES